MRWSTAIPLEEVCEARRRSATSSTGPNLRLVRGDAAAEILRATREVQGDLIVMGTHGRTGLGRLLMGSVAETILRGADCPVLTVRVPLTASEPASPNGDVAEGASDRSKT